MLKEFQVRALSRLAAQHEEIVRMREQAREPEIIKTVRGKGYVLATRVDEKQADEKRSEEKQ